MEADARPDGWQGWALTRIPTDTIFALSSGAPPAAVAVVRISGPQAHAALKELAGKLPEPRHARLARLRFQGEVLDDALVFRFDGPASETGEDVVELQLHGGRAIVAAVLAALGEIKGLRLAEPGEFTRRSYANGRIDLAQAEGLADLIEAETEAQRRAALSLSGGALSRRVARWQAQLLAIAAQVEAEIDFADEGDVVPADIGAPLAALRAEITGALAQPPAERLRDGIRVVIAGPPNSGKSTLINALAGREAAIVSPVPGTTRDVVEVPIALRGIPFVLADTAGLRDKGGRIEALGVALARDRMATADILLWLGAPAAAPAGDQVIRVHAKVDICAPVPGADLAVSALTGAGMDSLVALLIERSALLLRAEGEMMWNSRHRRLLQEVKDALEDSQEEDDRLLVAEALRVARTALDRITGRAGVEDMLDTLFSRFCLGK